MYVVIHFHDFCGIVWDDCRYTSDPDAANTYAENLREEFGSDREHQVWVHLLDVVGWEDAV